MHGMGFLEAARTPVGRLMGMRAIRRSVDAEGRLGRLADLGALFGGAAAKRHLETLTGLAAGTEPPGMAPALKREEDGKVTEGGAYVPGHSYVTG